jgi:NodT family efflux transporter outer membrane factor (OMF) lipoprotein
LIDEALSNGFTLKEAWARLRQARALAVQAGAERYPDLTGSASADFTRRRSEITANGSEASESYALGLVSSYELDLWGRIRSQREAALFNVKASAADLQTANITVAAEVADRWVRIISLRLQKLLLDEQLANNLTFLELIELRFRNGMVSALDVYQQKQAVENVRARIPLVEAETQLLMHELAVLIGRPPRSELGLTRMDLPVIGRLPAVGLPADLLANRPDVRAAGMRLKAADWQVAAARANRLPALRFIADGQYGGSDLDLLFETWLLRLAANLTAPIFDGGRRAAEVDLTRAQADENLWAYRRTVLTAVKEVEDALTSETRQRELIKVLEAAKAAARKGLDEAISRYRRGLSDYLPVLTQLLTVQDLERNLISQQEQLILFRVGLYRALGGGWLADAG